MTPPHDRATTALAIVNGCARRRAVGPWGTATRVLVGSTFIVLAVAIWDATALDMAIGLVVLPALRTRRRPRCAGTRAIGRMSR